MKKNIFSLITFAFAKNKKFLSIIVLFIALFGAAQFLLPQNINSANAANLWDTVKSGGVEKIGTDAYNAGATSKDPRDIVIDVVKVFLTFLGVIFIALIMLAGYKWMTSQGNQDKVDEAKQEITRAIIGLMIIMAVYAITTFVFTDVRQAVTGDVW